MKSGTIEAVMTPFGPYYPGHFEIWAYMRVYGPELNGSLTPKWEVELLDYATEQVQAEWLTGKH
jgi:hypothetical protein